MDYIITLLTQATSLLKQVSYFIYFTLLTETPYHRTSSMSKLVLILELEWTAYKQGFTAFSHILCSMCNDFINSENV